MFKGVKYGSVLWVWNVNIGLLLLLGLSMSHVGFGGVSV